MTGIATRAREEFLRRYGRQPRLYWAPGRVNLIGEHTDYNGGFVMPAAIDLGTVAAVAPRSDGRLRLASLNLPGELDEGCEALRPRGDWTDYAAGVAVQLGFRTGADVLFGSTVPLGAGLSSSAAIAVATALALGARMEKKDVALLCQRSENEFAGARCGIMDPFTSCLGEGNAALWLDCRDLRYETVPIPANVRLVIANTMVRHTLAAGEYNLRRAACESAARKLGVRTLREASIPLIKQSYLNAEEMRCAHHVVRENERVARFAQALRAGDLVAAGRSMAESHTSLRDDFRVSCKELDTMASLASRINGVYGARMTGGGFGGCTINLVDAARVEAVTGELQEKYRAATGISAEVYACRASAGAHELTA